MAYQSGEFIIPNTVSGRTKAVTIFNNMLFLLDPYPGYNTQVTLDLSKLKKGGSSPSGDEPIDGAALTNPANWISQNLNLPSSTGKPGLVSFAGAMFAFLNQFGGSPSLIASTYSLSGDSATPGTWSPAISLVESDGATVPVPIGSSDVSATTVGDNIVILACAQASSSSNPNGGTFVAIYDTRDLDTSTNKWPAKWQNYISQGAVDRGAQVSVSVEWFTTVLPDSDTTDGPTNFVAVMTQLDQGPTTPAPVNLSFYAMTIGESAGSEVTVTLAFNSTIQNALLETFCAGLVRDPAGRIRTWFRNAGAGTEFTAALMYISPGEGLGINPSPESVTVTSGQMPTVSPCSLFFVFTDAKMETTFNGQPATQYPVYEFVFYGSQGNCQVNRCGTIETVPNFSVVTTNHDTNKPLNIITGIIDGPIPIPLENYANYDPGPGQTNAGSMTYGLQNSEDSSHQVSNDLSVGLESKGQVVEGVGAAWDISLKGGTGSVTGDSTGTTTSYDLTVKALITTALGNNNPSIVTDGVLRSVGAQFSITAFRYLDNFGPNVDSTDNSDTTGVKAATVTMSMVDDTVLNFTPYMVTPGVLESYTPEAINETMKSVSSNYFGDVIVKNAFPFLTSPPQPYLSYSWSTDGASGQAFDQWTSSFLENSWHLDLHAYGGISGSSGVKIFGLGEDIQWSLMAGVDYSHNTIADSDTRSGWSIGLVEPWGPPNRKDLPASVSAYDFRVYFLPVPTSPSTLTKNYWTTELIEQTRQTGIDGNSGCWRIVYVVTRIEHHDGSKPYHYDGSLG